MTDLPTAKDYKGGHRLLVWCKACRLQRELTFKSLVADGRSDIAIINLRFRCTNCGSRLTDSVGYWNRLCQCLARECRSGICYASYRRLRTYSLDWTLSHAGPNNRRGIRDIPGRSVSARPMVGY